MINSQIEEARKAAIAGTKPIVSHRLLESFPDLVAHPGPVPGVEYLYYQDCEITGPICATAEECHILYLLTQFLQPTLAIEIGSYIGWTAAHIAAAMMTHGALICIDDMSEANKGDAQKRRFIENIDRCGYSEEIRLVVGRSPEVLSTIGDMVDLAFIDGDHQHGQPTIDVQAMARKMAPHGLLVLHDTWMPGVSAACNWLTQDGWVQTTFPTPARLAIFYKQEPEWWQVFMECASE